MEYNATKFKRVAHERVDKRAQKLAKLELECIRFDGVLDRFQKLTPGSDIKGNRAIADARDAVFRLVEQLRYRFDIIDFATSGASS